MHDARVRCHPVARSVAYRRVRFPLHAAEAARGGPLRGAGSERHASLRNGSAPVLPSASVLGFRLHQRARSGANNPDHAKLAGGHVL